MVTISASGGLRAKERELEELQQQGRALFDRYVAQAEREDRELTQSERDAVDAIVAKSKKVKRQLDDQAFTNQVNGMLGQQSSRYSIGRGAMGGSLGAQFVGSDQYQHFREHFAQRGQKWSSGVIELQSELLDSDTGSPGSGGDLIVPDFRPGIQTPPRRRLTIADLMAPGTTDSNAIIYMRETAFENNADTVAEGGLKPESGLRFDQETDRVYKIAHWLPVTEEMLEDVPVLRAYIDATLRYGVQLKEEDKLLHGAASPEELTGILNREGLAAPIVAGGSPADSNADAIARQIGAIENAEQVEVTGIVMNGADWLTMQIMKDANGAYLSDGPFAASQRPMLWGRPVVVTPVMPAGQALVGAFKKAQVFRKGGIRVEASNSHDDYFIRNLVAIRAEERLALAVYRPGAFGLVTNL